MTALNIFTALFIMAATFGAGKGRYLLVIGVAALVLAPAAMGIIDGVDGLAYSLAGALAALLLTFPLTLFGLVSRTDVIISVALGGVLGAVQYAVAFCIATAFLSIQRILKIEAFLPAAGNASAASPYGAGLLAFDEKSALVEIEAMKMLRRDGKDVASPPFHGKCAAGETNTGGAAQAQILPWCAKLAIATLAVLMIGVSI